jgi:Arc/MetJ-type ribon-helix-helix transcriptional regulator
MTQTVIRKTFTLTQKDIEIIRSAIEKCGFVSDSEALRHIIRYFAEHAPCLKT